MDYKEWINNRASQLANDVFDCEFINLPPTVQSIVYNQSCEDYKNELADLIDCAYEGASL